MGTIAMMELKRHYSRTFEMSLSFKILRIHICTFGAENFNGFRAIPPSRSREIQRGFFMLTLHICAGSQVLFDYFDASSFGAIIN